MGFDPTGGWPRVLAACLLLVGFSMCVSWIFVRVGTPLWQTVEWGAGIVALFAPLAVRAQEPGRPDPRLHERPAAQPRT